MSSNEIAIKVENLSKCYHIYDKPNDRLKQFLLPRLQRLVGRPPKQYFREFWALKDVSFEIKKGETVGIIGRNGSGKSTLLQMICGTLTPTGGIVHTNGRIAALLELGSGFNPEFTGSENVYMNAAILGLTKAEIDVRFDDISAFADIGDFIAQPIKTYSSGMIVRLAFAVAIHVDPDILVVDEALAVGDTAFQQKCLSRICQMQNNGVSILLVTHSSNTLIEYCDRGIFLKNGQLILDGHCPDVVKEYADDLVRDEKESFKNIPQAVNNKSLQKNYNNLSLQKFENANKIETNILSIYSVQLLDGERQVVSTIEYGKKFHIVVKLDVQENIAKPCFGIQISSPDGITLWSGTTQSLGVTIPLLSKGYYEFVWDLNANFSGNRYVVALGAGQILNGEYKRHHRLDYAGHFDVLPVPHTGAGWLAPFPNFQMPIKLSS